MATVQGYFDFNSCRTFDQWLIPGPEDRIVAEFSASIILRRKGQGPYLIKHGPYKVKLKQPAGRSYLGPLDIETPPGYSGPFDIERFRYSAEEYFISVVDGSGARIRYDNGALVMGTRDHTFKKIVQADFQAEDS